MACSLPVLITSVAGAATELVRDGVNGYTFNPKDIGKLSELMMEMTYLDSARLREMGVKSQEKISAYSPQFFADSIIRLLS
jgi:glycosyltransferase involved in cell wall biosynthesis